ncbi:MAG TPA: glycoside hydrolase family 38 C-terminal domain-containing protein [Candidatus Limnocylindria bacterium]
MSLETIAAPVATRRLHLIGNAHIDPVWLWRWTEGMQEVKATFRSALDRMREYPDFKFCASSAAFYEFVEQNDPAMFDEIRERVAEGRWEIVGGWWVEPDCNMPSGESFARHALYAQRYFQQRFGRIATVGYNPDAFGHAGTLPQILRKSGLERYMFMRPQPHEKELASPLFWWESPDGSGVLAFRIMYEYCAGPSDIEEHVRRCAAHLDRHGALACFYGVGNHGGGPTRANLDQIARLSRDASLPALTLDTPEGFFDAIERERRAHPLVTGELQHHAKGCYAATARVKRWNRDAEAALAVAERLATVAQLAVGRRYPIDLEGAWKDVLFGQFHDILAGTAIASAYDDARDAIGEAKIIAARAANHAAQAIAWRIDIPLEEDTRPLVVFNPHPWPTRSIVEVEQGGSREDRAILDESGASVPFQHVRSEAITHRRRRISFVADLPPLGYRTYRVADRAVAATATDLSVNGLAMANPYLRVEIDEHTGGIARLLLCDGNVDLLRATAAIGIVIRDPSDTWGHTLTALDDVAGTFHRRRVRVLERGPVRAVVRAETEWRRSRLVQDYAVYADLPFVDVTATVEWREPHSALKLRFPCALDRAEATFEAPYGHTVRVADGSEVPGQRWIDVSGIARSGERAGLSILDRTTYSFDARGADLGLTVLRNPLVAHHDPLPADDMHEFTDEGRHTLRYRVLPHRGDWRDARTVRAAIELNEPALAHFETFHAGPLPQRASFVEVESASVIGAVVKRAEDGDDIVVRCYESSGRDADALIRIAPLGREIRARFRPHEIKTLAVPRDPSMPVREVDLLERPC